ncbi:MAG: hypothetical protein IJU84_08945 [Clostridia bacterium]|nr:hypothetical protein [Clostridia bacterium]
MKNGPIKEYEFIEEEFFDIDKERRTARVKLAFDKPSSIFDVNYSAKMPVFSDDFSNRITYAFRMIPAKYKVELDVTFADAEGYTDEMLRKFFKKNLMLDFKTQISDENRRGRVAFGLIGVGVIMFAAMILMNRLWITDSVIKDIFVYVSDIATTVTFWEAMTILVVERKEKRSARTSLAARFASINFHLPE